MITLTKVDGRQIIINADEIEYVEGSHDTTLTLKSGKKIIVREQGNEIIEKVIAYRQECFTRLFDVSGIKRQ